MPSIYEAAALLLGGAVFMAAAAALIWVAYRPALDPDAVTNARAIAEALDAAADRQAELDKADLEIAMLEIRVAKAEGHVAALTTPAGPATEDDPDDAGDRVYPMTDPQLIRRLGSLLARQFTATHDLRADVAAAEARARKAEGRLAKISEPTPDALDGQLRDLGPFLPPVMVPAGEPTQEPAEVTP